MSYDLDVWCAAGNADVAAVLPERTRWTRQQDSWVREARGWQILVDGPDRALTEDVPEEVAPLLAGIEFVYRVVLEPSSAPASAKALAKKVARALAKAAHGVVVDQVSGTVATPEGVRRFAAAKRKRRFSVLEMAWWFTESPLLHEDGLDRFIDLLARDLPEALPRRYGRWEPPQFRLEESGLDHFRQFLVENGREFVVWYPSRPVVSVRVWPEPRWGFGPQGFRCGHAHIEVESAALAQPGWYLTLRRFWRRASHLIQPFYGEVRTLRGLIAGRATYFSDGKTEVSPTSGPFWRGIPRDPGHACVCGPAYLTLWPAFQRVAEIEGQLGFVSAESWTDGRVLSQTGPVPEPVAQRRASTGGLRSGSKYPIAWPFGNRAESSNN